jgi:hypothetical protein
MTLRAWVLLQHPRACALAACSLWLLGVSLVHAQDGDRSPDTPPASPVGQPDDSSAAGLLARAEEAMTTIDYERSRQLSERAIEKGGLEREELIRAYRLIAVSCAQLDAADAAELAFTKLFALEPDSNIATRIAPTHRTAILNARGFWDARKNGFGIDVNYARRERQVIVNVRDPIGWAHHVHVWSRFGERRYAKTVKTAGPEVLFDIEDIGPTDALEIYAFATDEHGNVLMQFGRDRDPHLFGMSDEELAEFMRRDIRGGQLGSFGRRLEELGVEVGVHGYASLELKPVNGVTSFDLHHATVLITANLLDAVSVELAFEWEHLGIEADDFYLPHAFIDIAVREWLVIRGGFFEVPVGAFNEYLYPDFLRITGLPPLFSLSVVPALWSEVGVQLRGRIPLGREAHFTYAAFVSNGLEQRDANPMDGKVEEGGELAAMRFHGLDEFSGNKAVGGRAGLEVGDFDVGASGYTGRYTIEADRRLSIVDADISFRGKWLTVRSEGAIAMEELTERVQHKYGLYTLVAVRPLGYLEPYAQYDYVDVSRGDQRVLVGCAFYPFPNARATRNLRLKSEAGYEFAHDAHAQFVWFFQLTTGF